MLQSLTLLTVILSLLNIFNVGNCRVVREDQNQVIDLDNSSNSSESYYLSNQIPADIIKNCKIQYACKQKLKRAEVPKPCIKYCIKFMECQDGIKTRGQPDHCLVLNEQLVANEYNKCKDTKEYSSIQPAAMIDFPCQPSYLPDSKGRCREVW